VVLIGDLGCGLQGRNIPRVKAEGFVQALQACRCFSCSLQRHARRVQIQGSAGWALRAESAICTASAYRCSFSADSRAEPRGAWDHISAGTGRRKRPPCTAVSTCQRSPKFCAIDTRYLQARLSQHPVNASSALQVAQLEFTTDPSQPNPNICFFRP